MDVSSQVRLGIQSGLTVELELDTSIERNLWTYIITFTGGSGGITYEPDLDAQDYESILEKE